MNDLFVLCSCSSLNDHIIFFHLLVLCFLLRPDKGRQPGGYARRVQFRSLKRSGKHRWPHPRVNFGLWSAMFDNTHIHNFGKRFSLFDDQSHISWEQRNIWKDHQPDPKVTSTAHQGTVSSFKSFNDHPMHILGVSLFHFFEEMLLFLSPTKKDYRGHVPTRHTSKYPMLWIMVPKTGKKVIRDVARRTLNSVSIMQICYYISLYFSPKKMSNKNPSGKSSSSQDSHWKEHQRIDERLFFGSQWPWPGWDVALDLSPWASKRSFPEAPLSLCSF